MTASLRLLLAASRELAASFDYAATLDAVGRLVVPAFASGFAVDANEGEIVTTLVDAGRADGDARAFPLIARGARLGTMRVSGVPFDDGDEFDVWSELSVRIAVAIDAGRVYAREHHVADTLQRALLPERLPLDDRFTFDAAYRPGAEEAIVGGDWYDAFRIPDGRIAFSIGDVAGHGLRAAIVMGEVRQAFRAAALNPKSPSLVIERANTIVNMRANPVMVTAIFGIADPGTGALTYASAGHPPPVLTLPDGTTTFLPKGGVPLGIMDRVDATDWTYTLSPGARLVLYTDGATEYARDVLSGETRLIEAVRDGLLAGEREPARALLDRVLEGCGNTDDAAALAITAADTPADDFQFTFSGVPLGVPLVRRSLERYAARIALDEERRFNLVTAAGEALANAVEHAYTGAPGLVRIRAEAVDGVLHVTVEDEGRWKPAQRREERGRGVPIMRSLVDQVEIKTHQARTEVRLSLRLEDDAAR